MSSTFSFAASPFDCLDAHEQALVRAGVDIAYFPRGAVILDVDMNATHLFIVIKGRVQQWHGEELLASYGPDDAFDGRSLVAGRASGRFVAAEEVVANQLAREVVQALVARNAVFGARLFADLSDKLRAIAGRSGSHETQALATARVDEAFIRPALYVEASADVVSVVRMFQAQRVTSVLVRDAASVPARIGIFTTNALQRAVVSGMPLDRLPVGELASYALVTVRPSEALGDALATMIRHQIHRVVVAEGDGIVGVLEAMDLFSFLGNQSYLISLQIAATSDLQGLARAARDIDRLVARLQAGGTKIAMIASLVQALNTKLFERTWQLLAPPELVANSCLFVMGSEGRGEQLLKTDQDNALVLRDGFAPPADLAAICDRFFDALASFGYPPCAGGVMACRPEWRLPADTLAERVRGWLSEGDGDALMKLAIFMDAHAVAGDAALIEHLREGLFALAVDNEPMLARFAAAVDAFADEGAWWSRWWHGNGNGPVDIKRLGLFPIVHGVRSLALEARIRETGTEARARALVAAGRLEAALARDIIEALHFFMGLRLKAGLSEMAAGKPVGGLVETAALNSLERDLLKDALAVVRRFRQMMRMHFHLDLL